MNFITEKERIICLENSREIGEVTFPKPKRTYLI